MTRKILLVDDDINILRLYEIELKEEGYQVFTASNGEEALKMFKSVEPDLVSLDVELPDIRGIELLRSMKDMRPGLPIIMFTAYDFTDEFGVWASDAYVVKSHDLTEIKQKVKELIQR